MSDAAIACRDLTVAYDGHPAVHHLTGRFEPGSLTAVIGPNGAGKTSLLAAIMGRLRPVQGRLDIAERLRGRIAWLPQQSEIDRSFPLRVFDLVALGHWGRVGSFRGLDGAQHAAVLQALEAVGLAGF
jgi:zinc/manganese transport system ATP-binding protein